MITFEDMVIVAKRVWKRATKGSKRNRSVRLVVWRGRQKPAPDWSNWASLSSSSSNSRHHCVQELWHWEEHRWPMSGIAKGGDGSKRAQTAPPSVWRLSFIPGIPGHMHLRTHCHIYGVYQRRRSSPPFGASECTTKVVEYGPGLAC